MDATTTTQTETAGQQPTLFNARTIQVPDLKRLIRTAQEIVTEAQVIIDEDGIRIVNADPACVGLIDLHLKPDLFEAWHAPTEPLRFGLSIEELKQRVCGARKGDTVAFAVTREPVEGNVIEVFHVAISNGVTSTFSQPSLDIDTDLPEDELEFGAEASVTLDRFSTAIDRMNNTIEFVLTDDRLTLRSEEDNRRAAVKFADGSSHIRDITNTTDYHTVRSSYAQDYLEHVKRLKQTARRIHIAFDRDYPLRLTAEDGRYKLTYTLAPRIEET